MPQVLPRLRSKMPKKQVSEMSDEELARYKEPGIEESSLDEEPPMGVSRQMIVAPEGLAGAKEAAEKEISSLYKFIKKNEDKLSADKMSQLRSQLSRLQLNAGHSTDVESAYPGLVQGLKEWGHSPETIDSVKRAIIEDPGIVNYAINPGSGGGQIHPDMLVNLVKRKGK